MSLASDFLLLSTGLLRKPERSDVNARLAHQDEIERALAGMLEAEEPSRLLVVPERRSYFSRLVKFDPEYEANFPLLGEDLAEDYQITHMTVRNTVMERRPVTEIDTIVGPRVIDNSIEQDAQWLSELEVIESPARLVKDMAAGALLPECVALVAGMLPDAYAWMVTALGAALDKKTRVEPDWLPPSWMDGAMRIFLRIPFDAKVDVTGVTATPSVRDKPPKDPIAKLKIKPVDLQTPAQSTLAVPKVNR